MARPKTFDDDAVLDAALQLFWARGYDAVSVADLEAELGVGRQSLYNAFGDKRALFHRAVERYVRQGGAMRERTLRPERGLAGLRAYFRMMAEFLAGEGSGRGCLLTNAVAREAADDVTVDAHCRRNEAELLAGFRAALAVGQARGEVAAGLPLDAAARALVSHTYGLSVLAAGGASRADLAASSDWLLDRLG